LVVYYPLMQFGVDQAKTGALPPYCVWSGNLILSVVGLLLLRPVLRQ
jgi:lipopolysaccharide export system permease protein